MNITDDFKIMINKAILAFKDKDYNSFRNAIKYCLKELQYREYDSFIEYLYRKFEVE